LKILIIPSTLLVARYYIILYIFILIIF